MQARGTPRVRRIQTISLALLVTAGVVNYVDRATLAVANPLIRGDLGLTLGDMGLLLSAFLWAYAFAQLPAGAVSDRIGPRLMLAIGLSCWSLGQMLGGIVNSFWEFVGARIVLGIGEAPHFPTCARVSRDWFNIRQRGTATGIWNCASSLGTFVALPLLTVLMVNFGWRAMFVAMGVAGLALAAHRVPGVPRPARGRPDRRGARLPARGRRARRRDARHLGRLAQALRLSDDLGHDHGLFRLHLHDVALHRLAAELPRDRAPLHPVEDRHRRLHPVRLRGGGRHPRRPHRRHADPPRRRPDPLAQDPDGDRRSSPRRSSPWWRR